MAYRVPIMALSAQHAFNSVAPPARVGQSEVGTRGAGGLWSSTPERVSDGVRPAVDAHDFQSTPSVDSKQV